MSFGKRMPPPGSVTVTPLASPSVSPAIGTQRVNGRLGRRGSSPLTNRLVQGGPTVQSLDGVPSVPVAGKISSATARRLFLKGGAPHVTSQVDDARLSRSPSPSKRGNGTPTPPASPWGSAATVPRFAIEDAMDAKIHLFVQGHPSFGQEVWQAGSGRYVIRGREVVRLLEESRNGQQEIIVGVDGWQRPLSDLLEDLCHESALDRCGRSGVQSRRLLEDALDEANQHKERALVKSSFSALSRNAQRFSKGNRRGALLSLRHCWRAWACGLWIGRSEHREQCRSKRLERILSWPRWRDVFAECILSAWCLSVDLFKNERSFGQISYLRRALPTAIGQTLLVGDLAMVTICFLRWAQEVEGRRRRAADSFLLGEMGLVEYEASLLTKHTKAKGMLTMDWESPEANLTRLSNRVDGFMQRVQGNDWAPTLFRAVQRQTAKTTEPVQETMQLFEALARARLAARELQSEIEFVLQMQFFSEWVRSANVLQLDRRKVEVARAEEVFAEHQKEATYRLAGLIGDGVLRRMLRAAFEEWATMLAMSRCMRAGAERALIADRDQHHERLRSERAKLSNACRADVERRANSADERTLVICLLHWSALTSEEGRTRETKHLIESLQTKLNAELHRRDSLSDAMVNYNSGLANEDLVRRTVACWARRAQFTRAIRSQKRRLPKRLEAERRELLLQGFTAFVLLRRSTWARRIVVQGREGSNLSMALSFARSGFLAWANEARIHRGAIAYSDVRERTDNLRSRSRTSMEAAVKTLANVNAEATMRIVLLRWHKLSWWESQNRHIEARTRALRDVNSNFTLARARARHWQLRSCARFGDQLSEPIRWIAFACWVLDTRSATSDRVVARNWVKQQHRNQMNESGVTHNLDRRLRLRDLTGSVVDARVKLFLVPAFHAWRGHWYGAQQGAAMAGFRQKEDNKQLVASVIASWRSIILRTWIREIALRLGQNMVRWNTRKLMITLTLNWRGQALARTGSCAWRRLLAMQKLAPILSSGLRFALRRWRSRTVRTKADHASLARAIWRSMTLRCMILASQCISGWVVYTLRRYLASEEVSFRQRRVLHVWQLAASAARQSRQLVQVLDEVSGHASPARKEFRFHQEFRSSEADQFQGGIVPRQSSVDSTSLALRLLRQPIDEELRLQQAELARTNHSNQRLDEKSVEQTMARQSRRARAEKRFAQWYHVPHDSIGVLPKCFAAWTLVVLDAVIENQADALARRAVHLRIRFRTAADNLMGNHVRHLSEKSLLVECMLAFANLLRDVALRNACHGFTRKLRVVQSTRAAWLCEPMTWSMNQLALGRCFRAWVACCQDTAHLEHERERRAFGKKAVKLASRLVDMNQHTYGTLTASGAWIAWRRISWRRCNLLRLTRRRALQTGDAIPDWVRESFTRWARLSWVGRTTLLPLGLAFIAWRALFRGAVLLHLKDDPHAFQQGEIRGHERDSFRTPPRSQQHSPMTRTRSSRGTTLGRQESSNSPSGRLQDCSQHRYNTLPPAGAERDTELRMRKSARHEFVRLVEGRRRKRTERRQKFAEILSSLRWARQGMIFQAWHACVYDVHRARLAGAVLGSALREGGGLASALLVASFVAWADRVAVDRIGRSPSGVTNPNIVGGLSSRTLSSCRYEIRLRTCLAHWSRALADACWRRHGMARFCSRELLLDALRCLRCWRRAKATRLRDEAAVLAARSLHVGRAGAGNTNAAQQSQQEAPEEWMRREPAAESWVSFIPLAGSSRQPAHERGLPSRSLVGRPAGTRQLPSGSVVSPQRQRSNPGSPTGAASAGRPRWSP